jgi:hypothetical protein
MIALDNSELLRIVTLAGRVGIRREAKSVAQKPARHLKASTPQAVSASRQRAFLERLGWVGEAAPQLIRPRRVPSAAPRDPFSDRPRGLCAFAGPTESPRLFRTVAVATAAIRGRNDAWPTGM